MANKDLFKQAIAEAKSIREAAIANAKSALEETLTPHLKDLLAAKLQEMEDSENEDEMVKEVEVDEAEATVAEVEKEEEEAGEEAEDDSEESEDEAEKEDGEEEGEDVEVKDMEIEDLKDLIRDLIAQEVSPEAGAEEIEGEPVEADMIAPEGENAEEEIDLEELLSELAEMEEEETNEQDINEVMDPQFMEMITGLIGAGGLVASSAVIAKVMDDAQSGKYGKTAKNFADKLTSMGAAAGQAMRNEEELEEAINTVNTLKAELSEVNLLNAKLLYVNKVFKSSNLTESQKVNVIAAFDKAETVKEVKLVFETVSENVIGTKKETVKEHKGMASKATGITASKPGVIAEVNSAVLRMQKLAGIIK